MRMGFERMSIWVYCIELCPAWIYGKWIELEIHFPLGCHTKEKYRSSKAHKELWPRIPAWRPKI